MFLNVSSSLVGTAQSLVGVVFEEPPDQILKFFGGALKFVEVDAGGGYLIEELDLVLVHEGWLARDHLVEERAEAPEVDGATVTFASDDFRSKILRSPADGKRHILILFENALFA